MTLLWCRLARMTVALVGRPNVGKSTMFNRLVRKNLAIVNRIPGTTRDWKQAEGNLGPLPLDVVDTGGLEVSKDPDSLESRMVKLTAAAVEHADVVLFMVDASTGVTAEDEEFSACVLGSECCRGFVLCPTLGAHGVVVARCGSWIHKHRAGPVFMVANKSERFLSTADEYDEDWVSVRGTGLQQRVLACGSVPQRHAP